MADDDLNIFVKACQKFNQPMSIRGSTAHALSTNANSNSITESVPPLGDLDLIVSDEDPASAMIRVGNILEHYRTYVPTSRFIHADVFYKELPVREDSPLGNVVLTGLPEVSIGPHGQESNRWADTRSLPGQPVTADVEIRVPQTLFRDFMFLLRLSGQHEELEKATKELARELEAQTPRSIGLATRQDGGVRELARIDKALVKHVLLRYTTGKNKLMTDYLSEDWLHRFASYLNRLSQRIILSEDLWMRTSAIAYAVEGRVHKFEKVTALDGEQEQMLKEKLNLEMESIVRKLTPSLQVSLPDPGDPECCGYRDFSKGISELVFRDTGGGSLMNVALMEGPAKYYAVHAQASEGSGARSLRMDPGFMGILNHGSLGSVRLMGVRDK